MKNLLIEQIPSIIRWLLALLGAYLGTVNLGNFEELKSLDFETATIASILSSVIMILLSLGLKKAEDLGYNGFLAKVFIGPRVQNIRASVVRWLVTLIAGAVSGLVTMSPDAVASADLPTLLTAIVVSSFAFDRTFKTIKP